MTCIVGIIDNGVIYMGGDRGASDGEAIVSMSRPKIHIRKDWIFGYSGNIGTGQLLEMIDLPILEDNDDPYTVLRMEVVEELKNAINTYGDSESDDVDFLIGAKGRLFEVSSDGWGVVEVDHCSIGSGNTYALGSLYTSKVMEESFASTPQIKIMLALNAAITYSPTCQGPIDILSL